MIVALFGPSCTGKTTIAQRVMSELGLPLRSCGEAVKLKAGVLGLPLTELSDDEHRRIDDETRRWALANSPCLVEGRYLDRVLSPIASRVTLVRLDARNADREARRTPPDRVPLTITEEDLQDSLFGARMYNSMNQLAPQLILDSSELTVGVCVQRVIALIAALRKAPG